MAAKYSQMDFKTSMDEEDIDLYYAAELLSPSNANQHSSADDGENEEETPKKKHCTRSETEISLTQEGNNFTKILSFENRQTVDKIPSEILQMIFTNLPISDLLLSANRVCRRFNEIISDPKFLASKKMYFMYVADVKSVVNYIESTFSQTSNNREKFFSTITWSMTFDDFQKLKENQILKMMERFKKFPHFEAAKAYLETNFLFDRPTIWNYMAILILLSDDVVTIKNFLTLLTSSPEIVSQTLIVEFYYNLLLHVTAINKKLKIMSRLCYNIYHALFLFENSDSLKCGSFLTYEQRRIVNFDVDLKSSDFVRIIAFAGTGKTTTLVEYMKRRPEINFLVIFYNKSLQIDAQGKYPLPNVQYRTIHSIAFEGCKIKTTYDAYKKRRMETLFTSDFGEIVRRGVTGIPIVSVATLVKQTFTNFLASDAPTISVEHAPNTRRFVRKQTAEDAILGEPPAVEIIEITEEQKIHLVEYANEVWRKMKNPKDKSIPITHDGYLKMYQLSKPKFEDLFPNLDVILVDEAQDCNPTSIDIIRRQKQPKIIVGDKHQQIYSFRGSKNALDAFSDENSFRRTFYLTTSFRFGPEIAYLANCWLREAKKETRRMIVGVEKPSTVNTFQEGQKMTIICRKNAEVFSESSAIAELEPAPILHIVGGIESLGFDVLKDLYFLSLEKKYRPAPPFTTGRVKYLLTKCQQQTLQDLEQYAKIEQDTQLQMQIAIVKKFGATLLNSMERIRNCFVSNDFNNKLADFTVTTVHKAKGIEFENVRVVSDFMELEEIRDAPADDGQTEDEFNLPYVAITRAKNCLIPNKQFLNVIFQRFQDSLFCLKSAADLPENLRIRPEFTCLTCGQNDKLPPNGNELVLYRKRVALSNGHKKPSFSRDGIICKCCCSPFKIVPENFDDNVSFYDANNRFTDMIQIRNLKKVLTVFYHIYK